VLRRIGITITTTGVTNTFAFSAIAGTVEIGMEVTGTQAIGDGIQPQSWWWSPRIEPRVGKDRTSGAVRTLDRRKKSYRSARILVPGGVICFKGKILETLLDISERLRR
jgi:hypothetical protein